MSCATLSRKRTIMAVYSVMFGLVFSMTGFLYAMIGNVTRYSEPAVIVTACGLTGLGVMLLLIGINFISMRKSTIRSYSFLTGILLSLVGISLFISNYPDRWFYPLVAYALILYFSGIVLILLNIFVNGAAVQGNNSQGIEKDDRSVVTTFAGILLTNILPDNTVVLHEKDVTSSGDVLNEYIYENRRKMNDGIITETITCTSIGTEINVHDMHTYTQTDASGMHIGPQNDVVSTVQADLGSEEELKTDTSAGPHITTNTGTCTVSDACSMNDVPPCMENEPESTEEIDDVPIQCAELASPQEPQEPLYVEADLEQVPSAEGVPGALVLMKRTDIQVNDTMREAAHKLLMFQFGRMLSHERGTKLGRDIEELHDMRVAAMRMRSVFQVFDGFLDMKVLEKHQKNLKTTRRSLGQVRDLDVFLEKVDDYLMEQPPGTETDLVRLTDSLLIEHAKRRGMMLVYLDSDKYTKFRSAFTKLLLNNELWNMETVTKSNGPVECRVRDILPILLYKELARVRSYDEIMSAEEIPSIEQYHQLRIDVKILRYTLEFFREVLGPSSKDLIQDLKALQDNLGDMHDAAVAVDLLEGFEKYGKWGLESDKRTKHVTYQKDPGIEAYMEYHRQEIHRRIAEFPSIWSKVMGEGFSIVLAQTIAGMYSE